MAGENIHQAHDKLFKAGFSDPVNAAAFLRSELPAAASQAIEWTGLQLEPGSFVDSHFRHCESDLLFSAPLAGREGLVYLLFEHQTACDPLLALRLLRYMVRIWESRVKESPGTPLPVILPVVLAQNAEEWQLEPQLSALLDLPPDLKSALAPFTPDFTFQLYQLAAHSFGALPGTPAGMLVLRTMKAERAGDLLHDAVWDEALLLQIPRETFELILRYVLATDVDKKGFESKIEAIHDTRTRTAAMTLAQQYHQEGHKEGRQEGAVESRQQDVIEALLIRFGHVPPGLEQELQAIYDVATLRKLHRAAILAASLEEFVKEL